MKRQQIKRRPDGELFKLREMYREYKESLLIDKNDLDTELIQHVRLLEEVAATCSVVTSLKDAAKYAIDQAMASADFRVRDHMALEDERITEPKVERQVTLHKYVAKAKEAYFEMRELEGQYQGLLNAFVSRGYMLRDLVQLYLGSYYADSSVSGGDVRRAKEELADEAGRARSRGRKR